MDTVAYVEPEYVQYEGEDDETLFALTVVFAACGDEWALRLKVWNDAAALHSYIERHCYAA